MPQNKVADDNVHPAAIGIGGVARNRVVFKQKAPGGSINRAAICSGLVADETAAADRRVAAGNVHRAAA